MLHLFFSYISYVLDVLSDEKPEIIMFYYYNTNTHIKHDLYHSVSLLTLMIDMGRTEKTHCCNK